MNRFKNIIITVLAVFITSSFTGLAFAEGGFKNDGNDRKGKYLYKKSCRTCHDGSEAAELSPNSKTQAQWQRTFDKSDRVKCIEEWKKLSESDIKDIFTYLYNHGYDSPQPATCK